MTYVGSSWTEIGRNTDTSHGGTIKIRCIAYSEQNISNNTSVIHFQWQKCWDDASSAYTIYWNDAHDYSITTSGHSANMNFALGSLVGADSDSWHDIGSEDYWGSISHNADGSCSLSFDANGYRYYDPFGFSGIIELPKIPRYASVSQSVASASETSIQMQFGTDAECDGVWYSLNGGSWQGTGVYPHTGGYYTITGLSANTTYSIKTRVKRTDSQLYSETGAISVTTYDYPHATGCPAFFIGNNVMDTLYNPLSRSCTVIMYNTNWGEVKRTTTSNTSAYFNSSEFSDALYASIPNSDHGNYICRVVYGSSSRDDYGTYYVNANVCYPSVSGLTYVDTNSKTLAITGDASKIVQNIGTPSYSMTATARYHASLSSAVLKVNGATYNCTISGNKITVQGGVINSGNDVNATCQVTDSRGIAAGMSVKLTMLAWSNPTAINTVHRHNNFYSETDIKCDSSFSQIGSNALTIQYTATSQKGTVISGSLSDNVMITKTLDNEQSWTIAISLADTLGGKTTYNIQLQRGQPILFIDGLLESISVGMFPTNKNSIEAKTFVGNINGNATSASSIPLDKIYPVGAIYLSVNSTSPAELFGGTWEQLKDRFLLAAGDTYLAGSTGGEAQHTLTIDEIPSHTHRERTGNSFTTPHGRSLLVDSSGDGSDNGFVFDLNKYPVGGGWGKGKSIETDLIGGSKPHNNMPPYLAVYMWKRVS